MGDVTLAVHQPNYLPWLGYFNKMSRVDVFVFLDSVQLARRGYTHRVHVAGPSREPLWLTQSVRKRSVEEQVIQDVAFSDRFWVEKHLKTFEAFYRKATHFNPVFAFLKERLHNDCMLLSRFNGSLIQSIADMLGIGARILYASDLPVGPVSSPSERIARIAGYLGARRYLSGAGARAYNDASLFSQHGITLAYSEFRPLPYPQHHARDEHEFVGGLSIVDALFNLGFDGVADFLDCRLAGSGRPDREPIPVQPGESPDLLPSL